MKTQFYNSDSSLTDYALSCDYVEVEKMGDKARITLEKEHGTYHVKGFILDIRIWQSFDSLSVARQLFRKLATQVRRLKP